MALLAAWLGGAGSGRAQLAEAPEDPAPLDAQGEASQEPAPVEPPAEAPADPAVDPPAGPPEEPPVEPPAGPPADATAAPQRPFIVHLNVGIMLAQFLADSGTQPAQNLSIADRQLILQLVGFGYYVLPELRVMLSLQLVELVGGGPAGASPLALVGIIPWLGWHPGGGPFFVGIGPLFAPRSYGQDEVDLGIFTAAGVAFPLGAGFSAGAAVQLPLMLLRRVAFSIAPAAFLAYRF